jgi:hypothetical protein
MNPLFSPIENSGKGYSFLTIGNYSRFLDSSPTVKDGGGEHPLPPSLIDDTLPLPLPQHL